MLSGVFYFTAYATWKPHSMRRHRKLIDALQSKGVRVVMGRFKDKDVYCKKCGASFKNKEEKQTDVNIAVYLFKEAISDNYDTGILVTNDTDLVPAIQWLKQSYPEKKVAVVPDVIQSSMKKMELFWMFQELDNITASPSPVPD